MTAPDNPYFARTMVNRLWGHFFGRGIIHPIDDARSTNPPSNPELLDALAKEFAASKFDVKRLIRTICTSAAYAQLGTKPQRNEPGQIAKLRPLLPQANAGGSAARRPRAGARIARRNSPAWQASSPPARGPSTCPTKRCRAIFWTCSAGRPATRHANASGSMLRPPGQTLELVSSGEIHKKLTAADGYAARSSGTTADTRGNVLPFSLGCSPARRLASETRKTAARLESERPRRRRTGRCSGRLLAANEFCSTMEVIACFALQRVGHNAQRRHAPQLYRGGASILGLGLADELRLQHLPAPAGENRRCGKRGLTPPARLLQQSR